MPKSPSCAVVPQCDGVGSCCNGRIEYIGLSTYDVFRLLRSDFLRNDVGIRTTEDLFGMNILQRWVHPNTGMPICNIQYSTESCLFFEEGIIVSGNTTGRCLLCKDDRPTQCLLRPIQDVLVSGETCARLCSGCQYDKDKQRMTLGKWCESRDISLLYRDQKQYMSTVLKIADLAIRNYTIGMICGEVLFNFDQFFDGDKKDVDAIEQYRKKPEFYIKHAMSLAVGFDAQKRDVDDVVC